MTTDELSGMLHETVGRTRAAVATSLASIERSGDRVRDTLHLLMRSRTRFDLSGTTFSDDELAAAADRWQAAAEQREIEQEMLRAPPPPIGPPSD